jgi:hypothetical protein
MYPEIAAGVTPWASYEEIRAALRGECWKHILTKDRAWYQKSGYTWGELLVNVALIFNVSI